MLRFRVKIITNRICDVQSNQGESISIYSSITTFQEESVCDYNILIVDLRDVSGAEVMALDLNEFDEFLGKPAIILCIAGEEEIYRPYTPDPKKWVPSFSNYGWLPGKEEFKVINKKGKSLKPTEDSGRFSKLFNGYEWEWQCSFSPIPLTPYSYVSIANNITGQSVALRGDIKEGRIVVIPTPEIPDYDSKRYSTLLREIIDLSREEIEALTEREREEPDWIEKYVVSEEIELRDKIKKLQKQYQILTEAHKLFLKWENR